MKFNPVSWFEIYVQDMDRDNKALRGTMRFAVRRWTVFHRSPVNFDARAHHQDSLPNDRSFL